MTGVRDPQSTLNLLGINAVDAIAVAPEREPRARLPPVRADGPLGAHEAPAVGVAVAARLAGLAVGARRAAAVAPLARAAKG